MIGLVWLEYLDQQTALFVQLMNFILVWTGLGLVLPTFIEHLKNFNVTWTALDLGLVWTVLAVGLVWTVLDLGLVWPAVNSWIWLGLPIP